MVRTLQGLPKFLQDYQGKFYTLSYVCLLQKVANTVSCNLNLRVLRLFCQWLVAWRDSGEPGDQLLRKTPEDSGIEIASVAARCGHMT